MNLDLLDMLKAKYGVTGLRHLGDGGFGVVYSGNVFEVPRAIKVSRDVLDERWLAMTEQEFGFMKQPAIVDCPTIVQLIAVWRELGHLITVWELGEQSLAKRLAECQRQGLSGIPSEELQRHLRDAASALDVINGLGIRHRDIKPDNIILMDGRAKITDLGLAVFVGASSLSKTASGTMGYIAPEAYGDEEQGHGRLTATVDIYALAATAIKLATGLDPFGTNPREIIKNQEAGQPDTTGLTKPQAAAALRTLHPDPKQRPFTTATEFVAAFFGNVADASCIRPPTVTNEGRQSPGPVVSIPLAPVSAVQAFDFDLVEALDTKQAEVRKAIDEAKRLETAGHYGGVAGVGAALGETPVDGELSFQRIDHWFSSQRSPTLHHRGFPLVQPRPPRRMRCRGVAQLASSWVRSTRNLSTGVDEDRAFDSIERRRGGWGPRFVAPSRSSI